MVKDFLGTPPEPASACFGLPADKTRDRGLLVLSGQGQRAFGDVGPGMEGFWSCHHLQHKPRPSWGQRQHLLHGAHPTGVGRRAGEKGAEVRHEMERRKKRAGEKGK